MGIEPGRALARRRHLIDGLNGLIEMSRALVLLYDAVLERIDDESLRRDLARFRSEHQRHIHDLGHAVRHLGGRSWRPDLAAARPPTRAPALEVVGGRPLLELLDPSEEMLGRACEAVLRVDEVHAHPEIEAVVERGLDDDRRHEAWLRGVLTAI
ncbi:MAG: hypothetical protein ACQEXJ_13335 [Myxococcota bacterium]